MVAGWKTNPYFPLEGHSGFCDRGSQPRGRPLDCFLVPHQKLGLGSQNDEAPRVREPRAGWHLRVPEPEGCATP